MKTRQLILLISIVSISLILVFSLIFNTAIRSKNKILLQEEYKHLRNETQKVQNIKNIVLDKFVFDNSYWDEVVTALKSGDSAWFAEQLVPASKTFEFDNVWIFDKKGVVIYAYDDSLPTNALEKYDFTQIIDSLHRNPFTHFFITNNGVLTLLYSAPIQPGIDNERITPPFGYMICGRKFNANYVKSLNALSDDTRFSIMDTTAPNQDSIDTKNNIVTCKYPLKDFNGNTIKHVIAVEDVKVITSYNRYIKKYFLIYLSLLSLILFIYYLFMHKRVLKPLSLLSNSLRLKSASFLGPLKTKKDEFGDLALLVDDFFVQNNQLEKEIAAKNLTEAALIKSAKELEQSTIEQLRTEEKHNAKSEFLSTMSHEIRTPINGILGIANLLKDEPLSASQSKLVATLVFSSNHLLSIVSDILDFSKIESGALEFDKVPIDLKKIFENVYNLYQPKAMEKNIDFVVETDDKAINNLMGDNVRLCQILNNLISNAIKFTHHGHVRVGYQLLTANNDKPVVQFSIEDTGIGIAASKVEDIFESFTQADRTITANYGGTGLGLTITKKLVELQGGKISVRSKEQLGTTFTFFLPFETITDATALQADEMLPPDAHNLEGLKVLVAEDNHINALILNKFLHKWNVAAEVVTNGKEALTKLENSTYDVVLLDLQMPIMNGMEAIQIIRNHGNTTIQKIPVIALTADATPETLAKTTALGFNKCVTKPFVPNMLLQVLKAYSKKGNIHT
jgi:signal transduction histidine kinase/CheY-like chemotaxis protein/sensor domain CHASE-containing protein